MGACVMKTKNIVVYGDRFLYLEEVGELVEEVQHDYTLVLGSSWESLNQ